MLCCRRFCVSRVRSRLDCPQGRERRGTDFRGGGPWASNARTSGTTRSSSTRSPRGSTAPWGRRRPKATQARLRNLASSSPATPGPPRRRAAGRGELPPSPGFCYGLPHQPNGWPNRVVSATTGCLQRKAGVRSDLRDRRALRRRARQGVYRRVPRGLHLRGRADAVHPPGRVRRLRRLRAGLPGRGDLLRGRRPGQLVGLHQGQRRLLRRAGLARRRLQGRQDRARPGVHQGAAPAGRMSRVALPDFPWDSLAEVKAKAPAHPGGVVDLSIGTPVDPVPAGIRDALASVSEIPGYPTTHGLPALRAAAIAALGRRHGVAGLEPDAELPPIGSKEAVAWLPRLLGFGPGDLVVIPELAYPTYEVGVRLAGASILRAVGLTALGPQKPAMIWLNSPSYPTGQVLPVEHQRKVDEWTSAPDVVVVSDECYQ